MLREAVLRDQIDLVKPLISRMGPLGSTTLLHDAALKGHLEMLELLLAHQADVNSRNAQGATPCTMQPWRASRRWRKHCCMHGAAVDARETESGATPLHRAASWGRRPSSNCCWPMVPILIERQKRPYAPRSGGGERASRRCRVAKASLKKRLSRR